MTQSSRKPQQRRSLETHARILTAVSGLLRHKQFDEISVTEIAGQAGVSVGGLYSRFSSKEELIYCFHEQILNTHRVRLVAEFSPGQWPAAGIESIIRRYVEITIELFTAHSALLREIALRSRAGDIQIRQKSRKLNESVDGAVLDLLLARAKEMRPPTPALAVRVGLLAVSAALREVLLFGEQPGGEEALDEEQLAEEMVNLFLGYLERSRAAHEQSR
jgi:AcrR family transcriptional regulator